MCCDSVIYVAFGVDRPERTGFDMDHIDGTEERSVGAHMKCIMSGKIALTIRLLGDNFHAKSANHSLLLGNGFIECMPVHWSFREQEKFESGMLEIEKLGKKLSFKQINSY